MNSIWLSYTDSQHWTVCWLWRWMPCNRLNLNNEKKKKLKLLWLDLIRISVCHKVATWELAVMTFLSKVMSKVFGVYFDATLSIVKHIDHVSHSVYLEIEELALFAISWQGKPLLSWCVLLLSVIWTIVTLWSWTLPLIIRTITKKIQNHAAKVFFVKSRYVHVKPCSKKLHWLPVKERIIFKTATFAFCFLFLFFNCTLPPYLSSCFFVYTPSHTLYSSSNEKTFLCKVETRALVTGAPCLEQPSFPHPKQQFPLTVQNFS